MAIFGRNKTRQSARAADGIRSLPPIYPESIQFIRENLAAHGVEETEKAVAISVGNAIFNTIANYLEKIGDRRALNDFVVRYDDREEQAIQAPDAMVDWLVANEGAEPEFVGTLVGRLRDVLSKPG